MEHANGTVVTQRPSGGGDGEVTLPVAGRFDWLHASAYNGGWQYGEQGVLADLFERIGTTNKYVVEFGAGDGGSLPLTCGRLIDDGWKALLIEGDASHSVHLKDRYGPGVTVLTEMVGIEGETSIDAILDRADAPREPDLMVIDVDGTDYHILESMEGHYPRVLVVEHHDLEWIGEEADANEPPPPAECGKSLGSGNQSGFVLQASAKALCKLADAMGYVRVFTSRVNSVFVAAPEADKAAREMVRLNVGAGDKHIDGYISLDIKDGVDARKLPYADGSVDVLYASHVLEHFDYNDEVLAVLDEWVRVLRPGGLLRIAVPDVEKFCKERNTLNSFMWDRIILGGHKDSTDRHGSVFDETKLRQLMGMAGIGGIEPFESFANDCSRLPVSLNLDGRKRWFRKVAKPRVCMVLSQPRFTFTGHEQSLIKLAQKLKFDVELSRGAFWDRDMTIATQGAIGHYNPDILLYSDYDSVFDARDAVRLIDIINNDPTLAAVGVVQMERHGDKPLVYDRDLTYDGPQTRVRYQHFGLTAVRVEVFNELPLPWFWSIPGTDGSWTSNFRSDADITFWRMLREYGFRVGQQNDIVIGHIINAVKWPSNRGKGVILQPEEMYHQYGKPDNARFNPALYATNPAEKPPETTPKRLTQDEIEKDLKESLNGQNIRRGLDRDIHRNGAVPVGPE